MDNCPCTHGQSQLQSDHNPILEIEASQINTGGGKTLLIDLLDHLDERGLACIVWCGYRAMYETLQARYAHNAAIDVRLTGFFGTLRRYARRRKHTLFFCSIPPLRPARHSILYIHNPHLVQPWTYYGQLLRKGRLLSCLKYLINRLILSGYVGHVDVVACQTSTIQKSIEEQLGTQAELFPFYRTLPMKSETPRYDFCYIALAAPHKNHTKLFEALQILERRQIPCRVALTVPQDDHPSVALQLQDLSTRFVSVKIDNLGRISREEVFEVYGATRFMVFPSYLETFGLPLVEAHAAGLKILASDLPYARAVIEGLITFDPQNAEDIADKMAAALSGAYDDRQQSCLIPNRIEDIIHILHGADAK